jgi:hypothetical protein
MQQDAEILRKSATSIFRPLRPDAFSMAGDALNYGQSVTAVLLDAVKQYVEAAAKDRESQERERQAQTLAREARERRDDKYLSGQRRQGIVMLIFSGIIMASTIAYTVAAWRQAPQSERVTAPLVVSPLPAATQAEPQAPAHDQ